MAPAERGEPLGGPETRLKQLAYCLHIVLRQGRGHRERSVSIPWPAKRLQRGRVALGLGPACAARAQRFRKNVRSSARGSTAQPRPPSTLQALRPVAVRPGSGPQLRAP